VAKFLFKNSWIRIVIRIFSPESDQFLVVPQPTPP